VKKGIRKKEKWSQRSVQKKKKKKRNVKRGAYGFYTSVEKKNKEEGEESPWKSKKGEPAKEINVPTVDRKIKDWQAKKRRGKQTRVQELKKTREKGRAQPRKFRHVPDPWKGSKIPLKRKGGTGQHAERHLTVGEENA